MPTITVDGLNFDQDLHTFLVEEALPGTGVDADAFFAGFSAIVHDLAPKNRALLAERDALQDKIDSWYGENGAPVDLDSYEEFLRSIGYLLPEGEAFSIATANVDPEIATVAGPQLVVPVMNARYALNAANARWGSLYDALYGTDAIAESDGAEKGTAYNPVRGDKVIAWARAFLNESTPIDGAWEDVKGLAVADGELTITLQDGSQRGLKNPAQFAGYLGQSGGAHGSAPEGKNGLHLEIVIDAGERGWPFGRGPYR